MYLHAETYISGYNHSGEQQQKLYSDIIKIAKLDEFADKSTPNVTIKTTAMYWRKANAIHQWFVENVQGGEDECKAHYVSRENLQKLKKACEEETLEPTSGFFFGSTEKDEYYYEELKRTAERLEELIKLTEDGYVSFEYCSSW